MEVKGGKMTALKNSSQRLRFGHIFFFSLHMLIWKEEVYKSVLGLIKWSSECLSLKTAA